MAAVSVLVVGMFAKLAARSKIRVGKFGTMGVTAVGVEGTAG